MALKKKKKFKFTFSVLIRLLIFLALVYFVIRFLAISNDNKKNYVYSGKTSVLGEQIASSSAVLNFDPIYGLLPVKSQNQIENMKSASTSAFIQDKIDFLKAEAAGFPDKQIKEIQKQIVDRIYNNVIDSIEKK